LEVIRNEGTKVGGGKRREKKKKSPSPGSQESACWAVSRRRHQKGISKRIPQRALDEGGLRKGLRNLSCFKKLDPKLKKIQ